MATLREHWEKVPTVGQWMIGGFAAWGVYALGKAIFFSDKSGGDTHNLPVGNNLTYPAIQYKIFADAFETAVWGGTWGAFEDDTAMGTILMAMNTLDDVIALNNAYDKRISYSLYGDGLNLTQTVTKYLDNDVKQLVNQNYLAKGINFIWP